MASTATARRLTEAHRLAQSRLGAKGIARMLTIWRLLDPENLDATTPDWLRVAVPLIQSQRRQSAALASNYMTAFRATELGVSVAPFTPIIAEAADVAALTTSLVVTGPVRVKQATSQGVNLARAAQKAETASSRAAMRHILDGGRGTVTLTTAADRKALGWARATSGSPCAFCALMSSRGPVYKTKESAALNRKDAKKVHDSCNCTFEPVYHRDAPWPPGAKRYADIYEETAKGLPAAEARAAFRSAIEA